VKDTPAGTGVIVGFSSVARHIYAVTCAHVAPQGASVIRLNTTNGKSRKIELDPDDWQTDPSGSDVAIADITEEVMEGDDFSYIPPRLFVEQPFIDDVGLGIGDDGFMLGLYANHPGRDYNRISAKFGNISLMADIGDPIGWEGRPKRPAHLFDIRSRGGFSGSPVFVYRTPEGDLRSIDVDGYRRRTTVAPHISASDTRIEGRSAAIAPPWETEYDTENNIFLRLLGIHAAQYPEKAKVWKPRKLKSEADDDVIRYGDEIWINSGTTIVVPAWEIRALLNKSCFLERRKEREDRMKRENEGAPILEVVDAEESARPAKEGDERHAERFTALLDAALGKPKQGD